MNEFYQNYMVELLRKIFEARKSGNNEAVKNYASQLKELNKTIFLDNNKKQLILR